MGVNANAAFIIQQMGASSSSSIASSQRNVASGTRHSLGQQQLHHTSVMANSNSGGKSVTPPPSSTTKITSAAQPHPHNVQHRPASAASGKITSSGNTSATMSNKNGLNKPTVTTNSLTTVMNSVGGKNNLLANSINPFRKDTQMTGTFFCSFTANYNESYDLNDIFKVKIHT